MTMMVMIKRHDHVQDMSVFSHMYTTVFRSYANYIFGYIWIFLLNQSIPPKGEGDNL